MSVPVARILDLGILEHKSIFLFGPRQTGKTFLLRSRYPDAHFTDLLHTDVLRRLARHPESLREEVRALPTSRPIIIDEIQRLPELLNDIHSLIEEGYRFVLTGSSARKLRRGASNLLAGRALERRLFPFVSAELDGMDIGRVLQFGALPPVYDSPIPKEELLAYVSTYLREEIQAEGLVRRLEPFLHFLDIAGLSNGELLNYANLASDIGVSAKTVREYYQILEDTLIGQMVPCFGKTNKRKPISTPKFYLFDVGVANALAGRFSVLPGTEAYGRCLEHLVFTEIRAFLSYSRDDRALTFWRSTHGQEVDFLIGDETAIEVKATTHVQPKHLRGVKALAEDVTLKHKIVVSMDPQPRRLDDGLVVLPLKDFLERLWARAL